MKLELPDDLIPEAVRELVKIRERVGEPHMGHDSGSYHAVISIAEARREAVKRQERWDQSPLGRLLRILQENEALDLHVQRDS